MKASVGDVNDEASPRRYAVIAQASLCGLAAAVSFARAARTSETGGTVVALVAASMAVIALGLTLRSARWAIGPLAAAVVMELTVMMGPVAPPRLVNAIPLLFALGFAAAPAELAPVRTTRDWPAFRRVVTGVSFALMVPLGFAYLSAGLVAPFPDVVVSYVLYMVLVATTIRLARQRSWWVAAMPFVSAGLFFLMIQLGATWRGWSG